MVGLHLAFLFGGAMLPRNSLFPDLPPLGKQIPLRSAARNTPRFLKSSCWHFPAKRPLFAASYEIKLFSQADINIILVGECSLMSMSHGGTAGAYNLGLAQLPNDICPNTCVVLARPKGCERFSDQLIACIAAHETGHLIIGPGHPDQDAGPAPLPGSDRTQRLMHSASIAMSYFGKRLVKREWDKAEEWLSTRPNGDN